MFTAVRPALSALKTPLASRAFSKATIVGTLGSKPEIRQTATGKTYITYALATNKPASRDENGEIVRDDKGYAVHGTNWFTIFNFRPGSQDYFSKLEKGTKIAVEANIEVRTTETEHGNVKDILFREINHQVVSRPKTA